MLHGHRGLVMDLYWSPQGEFLATCGYDGTAGLWDVGSGRELLCLRGHKAGGSYGVFCVAFNEAATPWSPAAAMPPLKSGMQKRTTRCPTSSMRPPLETSTATSYVSTNAGPQQMWTGSTDTEPMRTIWISLPTGGSCHLQQRRRGSRHRRRYRTASARLRGARRIGRRSLRKPRRITHRFWLRRNRRHRTGDDSHLVARAPAKSSRRSRGTTTRFRGCGSLPDGQKLISSSGSQNRPDLGELIVWDAAAGKLLRKLDGIRRRRHWPGRIVGRAVRRGMYVQWANSSSGTLRLVSTFANWDKLAKYSERWLSRPTEKPSLPAAGNGALPCSTPRRAPPFGSGLSTRGPCTTCPLPDRIVCSARASTVRRGCGTSSQENACWRFAILLPICIAAG